MQILGHVVWFKMAIEELNNRMQELANEIRRSGYCEGVSRSHCEVFTIPGFSHFFSGDCFAHCFEAKYDVCNMLLARRDSLLKDCSSKLGPKDLANLRTDHFDQQEVFNSDIFSQVEDNMIKRLSIIKESDSKSYRDTPRNFAFRRSSHSKTAQEGNKSFRDKRSSQTPLM